MFGSIIGILKYDLKIGDAKIKREQQFNYLDILVTDDRIVAQKSEGA